MVLIKIISLVLSLREEEKKEKEKVAGWGL